MSILFSISFETFADFYTKRKKLKSSKCLEFITWERVEVSSSSTRMIYNDKDFLKLLSRLNRTKYVLPEMLMRIICKYWREGDMRKLIKLNSIYYSYRNNIFRSKRIPIIELARITCKCLITDFVYKICIEIDNIYISIYPSFGQYRIGDSDKMSYKQIDKHLLNPAKDCSIELKLKLFKALACEIKDHKHEKSKLEIFIKHQDIFDFAGEGRICINLENDIFMKNKHIRLYCWNGEINAPFGVYGDKCVESWDARYFMECDGIWKFKM